MSSGRIALEQLYYLFQLDARRVSRRKAKASLKTRLVHCHSEWNGLRGLGIGVLYDWSGWLVMGIFILWALFREQRWIITHLGEEVANGTISAQQYKTACSAWAQASARKKALFSGQFSLVNRFYSTTVELAYKKHQASLPGEKVRDPSEIDRLRIALEQMSSQIPA